MQDEEIRIDRLEDQLIDHPDDITKHHLNTSLDETFQEKLNAKAEQIANQDYKGAGSGDNVNGSGNKNDYSSNNYNFLLSKSHLDYVHQAYGGLDVELNEWFCYNDFRVIGGLKELTALYSQNIGPWNTEIEILEACISKVQNYDNIDGDGISEPLKMILYFAFGSYGECNSQEEQLKNIKDNNVFILSSKLPNYLIPLLKSFFETSLVHDRLNEEYISTSQVIQCNYFMILTLLYFCINISIFNSESEGVKSFKDIMRKEDLISSIFSFIDKWKNNSKSGYRIKNLTLLLWKLLLFEVGDFSHIEQCDKFLVNLHNIKNKREKNTPETKLKCSPLDYFVFQEDLLDKYPLATVNVKHENTFDINTLKKSIDEVEGALDNTDFQSFMAMNSYSKSISNSIYVPHSNKSHTILSQLPTQTVHIATPVPSPTLTHSDYMAGGEKIRKSYQVNQSTPFIYPESEKAKIPLSVEEASEIMKENLYDSYSNKCLWNERLEFMKQERGYIDGYSQGNDSKENEFDYSEELYVKFPDSKNSIQSILRVEEIYKENFLKLHGFIQIFIKILQRDVPISKLNFIEWKLGGDEIFPSSILFNSTSNGKVDDYLLHQLELIHIKEVTLKAFSNIVILLLKWFKINHIMKFHYLGTLLFDHDFISAFLAHLNANFYDENMHPYKSDKAKEGLETYEIIINQNKLMNPQIQLGNFEFFNNCLNNLSNKRTINLINKSLIKNLPVTVDFDNISHSYIKDFNQNYCHILVNLFQINNKILVKDFSHRILAMNDSKPSDIFKLILINYDNKYLSIPILKIFKKLVPYQGRKWKSLNMDLISLIYMNLNLSLKDTWLSGRDLENDISNSHNQDLALRSLLQFYNIRRYPLQMEYLGFELSQDYIPSLMLST